MKKNIGSWDSAIRLVVAAVLVVLFSVNAVSGTLGFVFLGLAAIAVITSFMGYCPTYVPLKVCTYHKH